MKKNKTRFIKIGNCKTNVIPAVDERAYKSIEVYSLKINGLSYDEVYSLKINGLSYDEWYSQMITALGNAETGPRPNVI